MLHSSLTAAQRHWWQCGSWTRWSTNQFVLGTLLLKWIVRIDHCRSQPWCRSADMRKFSLHTCARSSTLTRTESLDFRDGTALFCYDTDRKCRTPRTRMIWRRWMKRMPLFSSDIHDLTTHRSYLRWDINYAQSPNSPTGNQTASTLSQLIGILTWQSLNSDKLLLNKRRQRFIDHRLCQSAKRSQVVEIIQSIDTKIQ